MQFSSVLATSATVPMFTSANQNAGEIKKHRLAFATPCLEAWTPRFLNCG